MSSLQICPKLNSYVFVEWNIAKSDPVKYTPSWQGEILIFYCFMKLWIKADSWFLFNHSKFCFVSRLYIINNPKLNQDHVEEQLYWNPDLESIPATWILWRTIRQCLEQVIFILFIIWILWIFFKWLWQDLWPGLEEVRQNIVKKQSSNIFLPWNSTEQKIKIFNTVCDNDNVISFSFLNI